MACVTNAVRMWKVPARGRVVLSATRFGNFNLNRLLFNQCPPVEPHLEAQVAGLRRLRLLLASIGILAVGFGTAIAATFDGAFDLDYYPVWE